MPRRQPFVLLCCLVLFALPLHAEQDAADEDIRSIEVRSLGFSIDVPSEWELTLNERARRFIRIIETDEQGNRQSASLNILHIVSGDEPFSSLPEPQVYSKILQEQMVEKMPGMKVLSAKAIEQGGYKGVLVHFEAIVKGLDFKMNHYRFEHPEGKDAYIVTTGSFANIWDRKNAALAAIVSTISFTTDDE